MVCGKSWQGPMFQSVYFAGILVRFYLSLGCLVFAVIEPLLKIKVGPASF